MSKELIYTSAPRGLVPGSNGFCTVAMSEGMPNSWRERLETLSGYTRHYPADDPRNPVVFSHLRFNARHVLSRIHEVEEEHTGRTNHLAHHIVLDDSELPLGGPAWLLSQSGFLLKAWSGAARWLEPSRVVPSGDWSPRVCRSWQKLTGDAGWAGVLAEAFLDSSDRPAFLLYDAGQEMLPLFAEANSLLPPERRWEVTFSTYFTGLLPGLVCSWRGVLRGTEEARELRRRTDVLVIDIAARADLTQDGPLIEQARSGRHPSGATQKKKVAVPGGRYQLKPVENYPIWEKKEKPDESDPFESIPPMPPVPRSHRVSGSIRWRVNPLALVILLLVAAAVGGGGIWLLQRTTSVPSADEDSAGRTALSMPADSEGRIKKLEKALAAAEEQLDKTERKLRQEEGELQRLEKRYGSMMKRFDQTEDLMKAARVFSALLHGPMMRRFEEVYKVWLEFRSRLPNQRLAEAIEKGAHWFWLRPQNRAEDKGNKAVIPSGKGIQIREGDNKKQGEQQRSLPRLAPLRRSDGN